MKHLKLGCVVLSLLMVLTVLWEPMNCQAATQAVSKYSGTFKVSKDRKKDTKKGLDTYTDYAITFELTKDATVKLSATGNTFCAWLIKSKDYDLLDTNCTYDEETYERLLYTSKCKLKKGTYTIAFTADGEKKAQNAKFKLATDSACIKVTKTNRYVYSMDSYAEGWIPACVEKLCK